ncbi:hypothetical protein RND71_026405 [Anisodus tanguticus]|uniref:Uncharacterized protein n=1 Tax=Anisodus tanguticus TaxID=243964 RepID=A0AAE1RM91_9SOLA|nr:hypothetical protein RND71_026405 [Anisodus tanguticus]
MELCIEYRNSLQPQYIPHLRPAEYKRSRLSRNRRTVNRAYGGVLSGGAVRGLFLDFLLLGVSHHVPVGFQDLVEDQKIVKKVLKIQKANEKLAAINLEEFSDLKSGKFF